MRDPKPANSTGMHAAPSSPCIEGMRRPRPPAEEDDDVATVKRSYLPADALEQDAAQPLLPAMVPTAPRATGETLMAALAADAQSQLMLDRRLMDAVERAEPVEVWRLLKGGANVNFVDSRTCVTPIIVAMSMPFGNTMKTLLEHGADPNFINPFDGNTPLMVALYNANFHATEVLVENGANEHLANPYNGQTAWLIAQWQGVGQELYAMLAQRDSRVEQPGTDPARLPWSARSDDQDNVQVLPGAVNHDDTDGMETNQTMSDIDLSTQVAAPCPAVIDVPTDIELTGVLLPSLPTAPCGPWHTS